VSTYAYLGPAATFTEAALKKITGPNDQLIPYANVTAALNAVRKNEAKFALVPIENSIEGVVARTLDELATGDPLVIAGEVTLPVSFAFMVKPGTKEIKRIATHPHAEAQCRTYVATNYPHAEVVATNSTAAAAEALNRGEFDAAIASNDFLEWAEFAGNRYGTPRKAVEDSLRSGKSVLLEIEISGAKQVKEKVPEAILVFLEPPTWEELVSRLEGRGTDSPERRAARLTLAQEEMAAASFFDKVLINDQVDGVVASLIEFASA
jgi:guanylate kinase